MIIVTYFIAACFNQVLASVLWRWRDNRAETRKIYVKHGRHKLYIRAFFGFTQVFTKSTQNLE